jgi:hypothetical protein
LASTTPQAQIHVGPERCQTQLFELSYTLNPSVSKLEGY